MRPKVYVNGLSDRVAHGFLMGQRSTRFCGNRLGFTAMELLVVIAVIGILAALLFSGIQAVRGSARRMTCENHLRQMAMATLNYESNNGFFPPINYSHFVNDKVTLTAQAHILPFLEQTPIWEQLQSSENGLTADFYIAAPAVYRCPSDDAWSFQNSIRHVKREYPQSYMGNLGSGPSYYGFDGMFTRYDQLQVRLADIVDGSSNTSLYAECLLGLKSRDVRRRVYFLSYYNFKYRMNREEFDDFLEWCQEIIDDGDGVYNATYSRGPWYSAGGASDMYTHTFGPNYGNVYRGYWGVYSASSNHSGIVNMAFADGHVQGIQDQIDIDVWRALGTRGGGEPAGRFD